MPLTNARLAKLLYSAAGDFTEQKQRALRRAGRYALVWPEEASAIVADERSLTELDAVGPWVARIIHEWLEEPPEETDEEDPLLDGFITYSHARAVLADDPSWKDELRADLQMHSTYSDGTVSISEMAGAAATLGYGYIGITDHSKGLKIAGGIDEETLAAQGKEIEDVNRQLDELEADLRVLKSIELNFDTAGAGDMEPDALRELDVVVGSFHSKLRRKEDQTDRVMGAVRNPDVQIVGHPAGRMFGVRHGVKADWRRAMEEGKTRGKAFEINAQPNRQDLSIAMLADARDTGVLLSIGTDAHSTGELYNVDLSLAAAALAGIPKEQILNFRPLDEFLDWVAESRAQAARPG